MIFFIAIKYIILKLVVLTIFKYVVQWYKYIYIVVQP